MAVPRQEFEERLAAIREVKRGLKQTTELLLGDVRPESLTAKAEGFLEFADDPDVGKAERDAWLDEHTSGMIERHLIDDVLTRRQADDALSHANRILVTIDEQRAELGDEEVAKIQTQLTAVRGDLLRMSEDLEYINGHSMIMAEGLTLMLQHLKPEQGEQ